MARKRKATGAAKGRSAPGEDFNKRVRLNVDSYEDVAGSDDDFHIGRDKVLLGETPADKRLRGRKEREEFLDQSDEEVLGYSDEDDEVEDDYEEDDEHHVERHKGAAVTVDRDDQEEDEEDDEMNEWGASKQDYYGADQMETEQDALDEEAEAKRLQQKQLAAMSAADYGFDEDEWAGKETDTVKAKTKSKTVTEALPRLAVTADMGLAERLKMLKSRFPEFEPLSKEFLGLQSVLATIRQTKEDAGREVLPNGDSTYRDGPASGLDIKERAASAYLAVLAMYFALMTSGAADATAEGTATVPTNVKDHPIMDSLLSSRELWLQVKDLPEVDEEENVMEEADDLSEDMEESLNEVEKPRRKRVRKTKAQKAASAAARDAEARRVQRMEQAEADLADLDSLLAKRPKKVLKARTEQPVRTQPEDDSDFGETELSEKALADKAAKRKSLRFYTSQIAQKSNKRGAAGRSAGGDDDIPYRERLKDRQARLNAEATKKGLRGTAGDELGGESDEEDHAQAQALRAAANHDLDGEDYYQFIANKSANKKADKESLAAARKEALLNGGRIVESETLGEDGKRKISYAIEKNKGLTPHRKKDVRNPRVKKRKKYDERKKKLGSMRAVYKGGEGRGGYGGELTGIKSNLVKSRKL
ncbi:hypothetical protein K461DRAFT_287087 [Myriangium duriaei CBS 260.36]|uniref:Sas10 C-terminal domain-containing protein n=1 Tax=Myriangium duriaei CBS 260.36 TaxID=1168546 RepID=A0A9P4MIN1_9PEZI|nr:hypothetical protein K461DRAFT_287087 [Myriangium duriaei CBS 260.36]